MKTDFLKALKEMDNFTYTENGAEALRSTGNAVLDAFGSLSAMRFSSDEQILNTWYRAFYEDKELAMRLLFYVRDIRGGQGMRRIFRVIARNMAFNHPVYIINNLDNFLFFGRGDDILCLIDTPVEGEVYGWIKRVLEEDEKALQDGSFPSLLGKWLPSENASSAQTRYFGRKVRMGLHMSSKEYRQLLTKLRARIGIVESKMSQNRWEDIDFEKLPSRASMLYSNAFMKHVSDNYTDYLQKLVSGDAKVNAGALFPVDIIHKVMESYTPSMKDRYLYTAMWNALPNYFGDTEETGLCVVDVSGSMAGLPMEVAISLGMYCADKARGPFHDTFITFSAQPQLQTIVGDTIVDKVRMMERAHWDMNTDIEAVFNLILETAVRYHMAQEDLPSKLYIISDMQFDQARSSYGGWYNTGRTKPRTFMQRMKEKFAEAGYTMPALIYWNVRASECGMFQETFEGENVAMVSGYSPSLFKSVIDGTEFVEEEVITETGERKTVVTQKIDPITVMKNTLYNERYDRVYVG